MKREFDFPPFDEYFRELSLFLESLVQGYRIGDIHSWKLLEERVHSFFTSERMKEMEILVPGWGRMASYGEGVTCTHVICTFLGLLMLPEFQNLSYEQQELLKWMLVFHDVKKEIREGTRDFKHGFRSAVAAAGQLPHLGFAITREYERWIVPWSELTYTAIQVSGSGSEPIQDNNKLPEILAGIDRMFGENIPAALIVKGVLLHMSITVIHNWPQAAPLTDTEIRKYISTDLAPLLKVLILADNEGWVMFHAVRQAQKTEILETFQQIERLIST